MRRIDWLVLGIGLMTVLLWTIFSGKDGFKGSNATIVARSISVMSTIDGHVDNHPPAVGARVGRDELLVRIHNSRIDRGRLIDFDSEIEFLERDIQNAEVQQQNLDDLLAHFQTKAAAHESWMLSDVDLRQQENTKRLEIAQKTAELKSGNASRAAELYKNKHVSSVLLDTANIEVAIANSQVGLNQTLLRRDRLLYSAIKKDGAFFDNGDASYWDRMADEISMRQLDNLNVIATLNAQVQRATAQAGVERTRIGSTVEEEHRAPFSGLVNATYVTKGTRVTKGANLLQVLDCANPIVIVPLPEHRIAEFAVGMSVTVYPVDTDDELPGSIEYISSGPLIGHDQTLLVQENLTLGGVHAVVNFRDPRLFGDPSTPCQSAHRAVVVIHTNSVFRSASTWMASMF